MQKFEFHKSDIAMFSALLLENDIDAANSAIDRFMQDGCTAIDVVLTLLTASAQRLGDMWCSDKTSFVDVTIGTAALHQILWQLDDRLKRELARTGKGNSILLMLMPGDTHIFGVSVLEAFFRNSGWTVDVDFEVTRANLLSRIVNTRYDVVGFSVSTKASLNTCKSLVSFVRNHSSNKAVKIMAGGGVFLKNGEPKDAVGADATATDAIQALRIAAEFFEFADIDIMRNDHV